MLDGFLTHASKSQTAWAQMGLGVVFVPTNPGLADILGNMDFDFGDFSFLDPTFLDFQIPGFPDSRLSSSYT